MAPKPSSPVEIPACGCSSPGRSAAVTCYCGVEDLLRIIRRRYSLAVMNAIQAHEPARYNEIAATLPQASSSTLTQTLQVLEISRLVDRHVDEDNPQPRYRLTPSGTKLVSRLRALLDEVQGV